MSTSFLPHSGRLVDVGARHGGQLTIKTTLDTARLLAPLLYTDVEIVAGGTVERLMRDGAAGRRFGGGFSGKKLRRRRARLAQRLVHLRERVAGRPAAHCSTYDVAEASALETALILFDEALAQRELAMVQDRHTLEVVAELLAGGDVDGAREHLREVLRAG